MPMIIVGAGNFGLELAGWAPKGIEIEFVDDDPAKAKRNISSLGIEEMCYLAISDPKTRQAVYERIEGYITKYCSFCRHTESKMVSVGRGLISCPGSIISYGAKLGQFCHLNVLSSIGHHAKVGDFVTFSSHIDICGWCEIGDRVFIGSGARILPHVKVGDDAIIGAGAVVGRNVPAGATVYANFARTL